MSDTTLLLGPVTFCDFEIPSAIVFGGRQALAVHRLAGGARVIDALGRDDAVITFAGVFSGQNAMLRACAVNELRAIGLPVPLTWDIAFYTVIVSGFQACYENSNWIPFRLTCTVLRDEAAALVEAAASLATLAIADLGRAAVLAASGGVDLTGAQAALGAPGAAVPATANYTAAQSAVHDALSRTGGAMQSADATLGGLAFGTPGSADAGIATLTTATGATQQLAALAGTQAYLGRAVANLAAAST